MTPVARRTYIALISHQPRNRLLYRPPVDTSVSRLAMDEYGPRDLVGYGENTPEYVFCSTDYDLY